MYEAYFALQQRPFAAAARTDRFFAAASIQSARETITRLVERAEGAGLIVGPTGTGKTLLCQVLAEQFRETYSTVMLSSGRLCTRRALLQAILFELGMPYRGLDEGELRLSMIDRLDPSDECPAGMLLLVDEAHTLPLRLLEELRLLSNFVRRGQPRIRLVLAGGPALEERLAGPKLEALSQRLAARCYLESLSREETAMYIRFQLEAAGRGEQTPGEELFTPDALAAVYHATDGIARLVNQVCDHALVLACAGGQRRIDSTGIEEAWSDLQQLPLAGRRDEPRDSSAADVVEFGGLDEPPQIESPSEVAQAAAEEIDEPVLFVPFAADGESPERIGEIAGQLAAVDEDFTPAGTIGPEVEMTFPELGHPFEERYDDEEVVIDRYAALAAGLAGRQRVYSHEGRDLSRALAKFVQKWVEPELADTGADDVAPDDPADDPVYPEPAAENPTPAATPPHDVDVVEPGDADLIIVEDDPEESLPGPKRRLAPVRRQEYGQLFAKLRRG